MNLIILASLLGTFIWLASNGLSRNKQIELFLCFQLVVIFIGWFGFNNFYLVHIFRVIFLVFAFQMIRKIFWNSLKVISLVSTVTLFSLLGWLILSHLKKFFFILALGYDNSSHLAFFYRTWVSGKFEYGIGNTQGFLIPYSNLYNAYPSMQMETWATIAKIAGINIGSTADLVGSFVLLLFTTIILLVMAVASFCRTPNLRNQTLTSIAAVIFLLGGTFSSVIWSGFPPTIWGIIVAAFVFRYSLLEDVSANKRILFIILGLVVLLYSYQIFFFPFLILPLVMFLKNRREIEVGRYGQNLIGTIFLAALGSVFLFQTIKIKSYTFALGGIQFPSLTLLFGIAGLLIMLVLGGRNSNRAHIEQLILISMVFLFGGLLIIYGKISGLGAYYPVKVLYLFITLAFCYVIYLITEQRHGDSSKPNFSKYAPFILSLIMSLDMVQGQSHKFAFGGNSSNILREWKQVQSGDFSPFGNNCLEQIFMSAEESIHFGYKRNKHLNYVPGSGWQTDLLSRWSNSLVGRIDDLVLELTIPMGSGKFQTEVVESFKAKHSDVEVTPISISKANACSY